MGFIRARYWEAPMTEHVIILIEIVVVVAAVLAIGDWLKRAIDTYDWDDKHD